MDTAPQALARARRYSKSIIAAVGVTAAALAAFVLAANDKRLADRAVELVAPVIELATGEPSSPADSASAVETPPAYPAGINVDTDTAAVSPDQSAVR